MPLAAATRRATHSRWPWLAAVAVFLVLTGLSLLVWRQQVERKAALLRRSTADICAQAAQRLQILVEAHLNPAAVFAQRWTNHESRDFSHQRFVDFATVLLEEVPGYHAIGLVQADGTPGWVVPAGADRLPAILGADAPTILEESRRSGQAVLAGPRRVEPEQIHFYAALPLRRESEPLGFLIVDFRAASLMRASFHQRVRDEFVFAITDREAPLFCSGGGATPCPLTPAAFVAREEIQVRNRTWRLSMVAREAARFSGFHVSTPVPIFGVLLSLALGAAVFLLLRRMELFRAARDVALSEVAERQRAEAATRHSEARFRNVFNTATDGFLVLEGGDEIVAANAAAYTQFRASAPDLIGRSLGELVSPEQRIEYEEFTTQLERFGSGRLAALGRRQDGTTFAAQLRGVRMKDEQPPRILVVVTDLSERQRARQRQALLARKVLLAQEEERARLSRELHDELGQILTALRLELGWLEKQVAKTGGPAEGSFRSAAEMTEHSARELRRICRGLRPPLLDDLGLEPAIRLLVQEFEARTTISVDLDLRLEDADAPLPLEISLSTYRILQESLTNISRHADARAVRISLSSSAAALVLSVHDDGCGFEPEDLDAIQGVGIEGMRERAKLVGGVVEIQSARAQGTRIVLHIPRTPRPGKEDP